MNSTINDFATHWANKEIRNSNISSLNQCDSQIRQTRATSEKTFNWSERVYNKGAVRNSRVKLNKGK